MSLTFTAAVKPAQIDADADVMIVAHHDIGVHRRAVRENRIGRDQVAPVPLPSSFSIRSARAPYATSPMINRVPSGSAGSWVCAWCWGVGAVFPSWGGPSIVSSPLSHGSVLYFVPCSSNRNTCTRPVRIASTWAFVSSVRTVSAAFQVSIAHRAAKRRSDGRGGNHQDRQHQQELHQRVSAARCRALSFAVEWLSFAKPNTAGGQKAVLTFGQTQPPESGRALAYALGCLCGHGASPFA